jgi:Flp pilus assembly protein TadD
MNEIREIIEAAAKHLAGERLPQAEQLCTRVLKERPHDPDALRILGLIALKQDRLPEALELVGQASAVRPDDAEIQATLGLIYIKSGQPAQAETCFRRVLTKDPERAEILADLAAALQEQGKQPEAEEALRQAVRMDPELVQAWFNLGIQLSPSDPVEAVACFRRAQELNPEDWEIKSNLAMLLGTVFGEHEEAEDLMRRAALLDPGNPSICINLAALRLNQGDFAGAEGVAAEAATLLPRHPQPRINLGLAQLGLGRHAQAILTFLEAISLGPDDAQAHLCLGRALHLEGKLKEAVQRYLKAEALEPGAAIQQLAEIRLLAGQVDQDAWAGLVGFVGSDLPRLEGSLFLRGSGGLGQALLLLRFVPALRERGVEEVALECPPPVQRLLHESGLLDWIMVPGASPKEGATELDLGALPLLLQVAGPEDAAACFLSADADRGQAWRARLGDDGRKRVGFLWRGEQLDGDPHQWPTLEAMRPLFGQGDMDWYSLQYGVSDEELELLEELGVTDLADEIQDVAQGLAVMSALDLMITPDTAMAHLAGAAGIPAWVLLRTVPDWCWGLHGDRTPWYPDLRLFRRKAYGPWDSLIEQVGGALRELAV